MKKLFHLSIFLGLVYWLGGCDQKPAITPSGKTIKIGVIAPFSGPELSYGKEGLKGMEITMQLQPYLQNGDRTELVVVDNQNEQELTVKLLEQLIVEDKVSAIITFSSSSPVLAMAIVADKYKTPILAALATHPGITEHNSYISQLVSDDNFQGIVAALFVRDDLLIDKVAVFRDLNSTYSTHLASEFVKKFKSIGGEITDTVSLNEDADDLSNILNRVYDNRPELLYLPVHAAHVIRISREVRKLDWQPKMMGSDGLISTMLAQHREEMDLLDGIVATDFFAHDMPLTPFGERARERYREKYEEARTAYAALGAEAYALLRNAMNRCKDPADRECINHQIRSTTNFKGIIGNITIGPNGKAQRPLCINSIQGGRSKFIFKVY